MKPKFFLAYLRIKPLLFGVAFISLFLTLMNHWQNTRIISSDPWIVKDYTSSNCYQYEIVFWDGSICQPNELYVQPEKALEVGIESIRIVVGYQ